MSMKENLILKGRFFFHKINFLYNREMKFHKVMYSLASNNPKMTISGESSGKDKTGLHQF